MEDQLNNKSELGNLTIRDLFYKYIRFFPWVILSVGIALVIAFIFLRYTTRVYSATGSILIKKETNRSENNKFEDLYMASGSGNLPNEMEVLKSRPLMERVVRALKLETSYYAVGKINEPNIYKQGPFLLEIVEIVDPSQGFSLEIIFSDKNNFSINGRSETFSFGQLFRNQYGAFRLKRNMGEPGKAYIVTWQPSSRVAGGLAGGASVVPKVAGTGILLISVNSPNPYMCADVVNQLMQEYQVATIEDKNSTVRLTLDFIDIRLDKLERELDSIERNLLDFRLANNIINEEFQSTKYFSKLSETDKEINIEQMQAGIGEIVEEYLTDKRNEFERVPSTLGLTDLTLIGLITAYNAAQLERKALMDGNAPRGNVVVLQKEQEIEKLRQSLLENIRNLKSSNSIKISNLLRQSNSAESQTRLLPAKIRGLLEIQRQQESKLTLYKFLLEKKEETAISQASTISNSKIINKAYPNNTPIKPQPRSIKLMALLIGIALPGLLIFILEILNDKVTTRYDIEKLTPAPILGEIGHSFSDKTLFVTRTNRSMVAEQFRNIRSNLQYVIKSEKFAILVTSSFSGEGKSFVSVNMGAVMALAGKKTVILEFDIRKPKVLSGLGLNKRMGITNFLVGKATLDELPNPVPGYENLFVIGCGPVPPNPSELLLEPRVSDLFTYLKQHFDVVIIDTAPAGMVSDAMTLGKFSDCTLYLVRQGHTFKKQILLIDEFYQQSKLPKISIILNDVKLKGGLGYYGYGRYGYGKGYGTSYYEEDGKAEPWYKRLLNGLDMKKMKKNREKSNI